jgi:hypothetical protein
MRTSIQQLCFFLPTRNSYVEELKSNKNKKNALNIIDVNSFYLLVTKKETTNNLFAWEYKLLLKRLRTQWPKKLGSSYRKTHLPKVHQKADRLLHSGKSFHPCLEYAAFVSQSYRILYLRILASWVIVDRLFCQIHKVILSIIIISF